MPQEKAASVTFGEKLGIALCDFNDRCGLNIFPIHGCTSAHDSLAQQLIAAERDNRIGIDLTLLNTCIQNLNTMSCQNAYEVLSDTDMDPSCLNAIIGYQKQGSVCFMDYECAGDLICDKFDTQTCGTCENPKPHCVTTCESMEDCLTEICDSEGCTAGPCDTSDLQCETQCYSEPPPNSPCTGPHCAEIVAEGDVCTSDLNCAAGQYCGANQVGQTICKRLRYDRTFNEICNNTTDFCSRGLYCNDGTCEIRQGLGDSCAADEPPCEIGAYCDLTGSGVCLVKKPDSYSCAESRECHSGLCRNSKCISRYDAYIKGACF